MAYAVRVRGQVPQVREPASVWNRELPGSLVLAAGQPLLLLVASVFFSLRQSDYESANGGAFGVMVLFCVAPLLFPLLGLLHTALFALPVTAAARALGRRTRLPAPALAVLLGAALAALYAAEGWRHGLPFGATWAWVGGLAVLPVGGALYARARDTRPARTLALGAAVTVVLLLVLLLFGTGFLIAG
ncbi:hypothetical protein ACQKM2_30820 [Streptomyces sp. NPDC004126]|uniref:hypothetical protein n=1 Tax=Streptomyces sp. NPDC004126 TaxID=3390695 RepID=UPI003D04A531